MALKVWLPLNKDTRNVGLTDVNVTNHGAVLTTGGVYNDCYHFGTASSYMTLPPSCMTGFTTACTVSFWFRIKTWNTSYATFFQAGKNNYSLSDYIFGFLRNSSNSTVCFTISNGSTSSSNAYLTSSLNLNVWYHVALTYETGKLKIYLNGNLDHEYTTTIVPNFAAITRITLGASNGYSAYQTDCDMNDIRIYDHCITEEDVKRIYQKKIFDLVPYSGIKNVLFDRSGFINMPLVNSNAVFQNNALYFNGSAKLRPKNGNVGFTMDDGTLSVWFTIETASTTYQIIYVDSVSKFAIGYTKNDNSFYTTCNGINKNGFNSNLVKFDGSINNIIVSYDTNKTPNFMLVNGTNATTNGNSHWTESNGLTIGSRMYNSAQSGFKGKLLKVGVYNRQFTQDEAVELYNSERGMFLPDDYIQLEYIQSTGTQLINTELMMKVSIKIDCKFQTTNTVGLLYGTSNTNAELTAWGANSGYNWRFGNVAPSPVPNYTPTNINHSVQDKNGIIINNVKQSTYSGSFTFTNSKSIYIFGSPEDGKISMKLYSFKMYDNDILVRNFVPAKRKSDNVIGMYDMVSRKFFTNSGTGSFTGA